MLGAAMDLAIYRRGVIGLSPDEVNAIFDEGFRTSSLQCCKIGIARMSAPFFGNKEPVGAQATLWTEPEDIDYTIFYKSTLSVMKSGQRRTSGICFSLRSLRLSEFAFCLTSEGG